MPKHPIVLYRFTVPPKKAPCLTCGKLGRRKRTHCREARTIAYKEIAVLRITYGEYESRCGCCKSFRTHPDNVLPKAKYDNKVREAVLEGILEDKLNVEAVLRRMKRDFLLDLSTGFVYDCIHDAVRDLDMAEHRQQVLERFSGGWHGHVNCYHIHQSPIARVAWPRLCVAMRVPIPLSK